MPYFFSWEYLSLFLNVHVLSLGHMCFLRTMCLLSILCALQASISWDLWLANSGALFSYFPFQNSCVLHFFSHLTGNFNSYLLNPYYVLVNMLSFLYIIYFDLYNNIELVLLSPFKRLGNWVPGWPHDIIQPVCWGTCFKLGLSGLMTILSHYNTIIFVLIKYISTLCL